jgi:hypothetical protein
VNRREKLIAAALNGAVGSIAEKSLDTVVRLVLGDMGEQYVKMWAAEGPGVMVFQPQNRERSMFFWTLKEIHAAQEDCERSNDGDMAESFRRILAAAQKIDPEEKAGYIINDAEGIRYFEVDYNKESEK